MTDLIAAAREIFPAAEPAVATSGRAWVEIDPCSTVEVFRATASEVQSRAFWRRPPIDVGTPIAEVARRPHASSRDCVVTFRGTPAEVREHLIAAHRHLGTMLGV